MKISLIVAMTPDRLIGANNALLWHLPNDFKHFKSVTMGKPIIMGRKTYESIGRPLPGRQNIILTQQPDFVMAGCDCAHSVEEALKIAKGDEVMIIGGAEIYRLFLPLADTLWITLVKADVKGDTYFPEWDPALWQETMREEHLKDEKHPYAYTFLKYKKEK